MRLLIPAADANSRMHYSQLLIRSPYSLTHSPTVLPAFCLTDKPICRPDQKKIYGVARNEAAEIVCEVDAFPPPENFKWSFNNTAETFDMPQSGFRPHSAQGSTLTYTPVKVSSESLVNRRRNSRLGTDKCRRDRALQMRDPFVMLNAKHVRHSIHSWWKHAAA